MIYDCIVIGAGAAGLFYVAADNSPGRKLILEKTSAPGQKLLLSGSGMCNITHGGSIKDFIDKYGSKGNRIRNCLYRHNNLELIASFENGGVTLTEREDGKIFPQSMKARDVLDFLMERAQSPEYGWKIHTNSYVTGIKITSSKKTDFVSNLITLTLNNGEEYTTRKLVVATGGASYPATGSDGQFFSVLRKSLGVNIIEPKPALAPVFVQNYPFGNISGVSFDSVKLTCNGMHTSGPLLFTHKGLSGPAALHISQYLSPGNILHINFVPQWNPADVYQQLKNDQPGNNRGISNYLSATFGLPKSFTDTMFRDPGRKFSTIGHKELENVCHLMTDRKFSVSGTGGWNEAMVTSGGVDLDQIDLKTMRLKHYGTATCSDSNTTSSTSPDIRIIGEALDINGDTGGYNLQFAYSSAMAAL